VRIACIALVAACSSSTLATSSTSSSTNGTWPIPTGWKHELIPFPLEFAPDIHHRGAEELRFPPGFLDVGAPGRWSYAFVWRCDDAAELDAASLAAELTAYFRGLLVAVDGDKHRFDADAITVAAAPGPDSSFAISAHIIDAFRDASAIELGGTARRTACGGGSVWAFVLAPQTSTVRSQLDELAHQATCGQAPAP
jgi:hypothetical protein